MFNEDQVLYFKRIIVLGTPYSEYDLEEIKLGNYNPAADLKFSKEKYDQLVQNNSHYVELASKSLATFLSCLNQAPKFVEFFEDEIENDNQHPHWFLLHLLEQEESIEELWNESFADTAYANLRDAGYSSADADSAFKEMEEELIENIPEERFREIQVLVFAAMQGATF
jgi:hypothetical protein